jgi:hypothetical protein
MSNEIIPSRRDFLKTVAGAGAGIALARAATSTARAAEPAADAGMALFAAPKLERVRVAFIGVGAPRRRAPRPDDDA